MAKKFHMSARGDVVNFDELVTKNPKVVALGNAKMNARGDKIGKGGKVITKVEDIPDHLLPDPSSAYNQKNPNAVKLVSLKDDVKDQKTVQRNAQVTPSYTEEDLNGANAKTPAEALKEFNERQSKTSEVTVPNKRKIIDTE